MAAIRLTRTIPEGGAMKRAILRRVNGRTVGLGAQWATLPAKEGRRAKFAQSWIDQDEQAVDPYCD